MVTADDRPVDLDDPILDRKPSLQGDSIEGPRPGRSSALQLETGQVFIATWGDRLVGPAVGGEVETIFTQKDSFLDRMQQQLSTGGWGDRIEEQSVVAPSWRAGDGS